MIQPKPFDPVIVTWSDAYVEATEVCDSPSEALKAYKPLLRKSIGFWVGRSDACVAIATDDDRKTDTPQRLGGISYIPLAMVTHIEVLGKKDPVTKRG